MFVEASCILGCIHELVFEDSCVSMHVLVEFNSFF